MGAAGDRLTHPLHRRDHGAGNQPPRRLCKDGVPGRAARTAPVRDAARRIDHRFLRRAEIKDPGLRLAGLSAHQRPTGRPGEAGRPRQRRARGCALHHHAR